MNGIPLETLLQIPDLRNFCILQLGLFAVPLRVSAHCATADKWHEKGEISKNILSFYAHMRQFEVFSAYINTMAMPLCIII